jgi:hypothetical protein
MAKKVNHVVVNGETIVDLRNDNVTPEAMVPGTTAHNAAGEQITGTYVPPVTSVNGKTGAVELGASDVGAVPTTRTVNGKALSSNITLSANDVGALPISGGTLTGSLSGQYITGAWLRTTEVSDKAGDFATIDSDGWIYKRTASEVNDDIIRGENISPATIELFPGAAAGNGGYIDFHYNDDSADYTSRLIEIPKGVVRYNGYGLLSSAHIVAIYNHNLSFTNGKAEYQNASIKANHPCFVQFRASAVSSDFLDTALAVDSRNDGILTIVAKNGATFSANVNILIISF